MLTPQQIRSDIREYFAHLLDESRLRTRHMKFVLAHIDSLPDDHLDLMRVVASPACQDNAHPEWQVYFPAGGNVATDGTYYSYAWIYAVYHMSDDANNYCRQPQDVPMWFSKWVGLLIEGNEEALYRLTNY